LADLQQSLRDDEVFLEFVLAEPASYCLIVSRRAARVQRLPAKSVLEPESSIADRPDPGWGCSHRARLAP
jgi:hypothetical protein